MKFLKKLNVYILMLAFIAITLNSCEKEIPFEKDEIGPILLENITESPRTKSTMYYNVYEWSNTDVNNPGLVQVLQKIKVIQATSPQVESVIQLKAHIYSGNANGIAIPKNTTIAGGGQSFGENGKIILAKPPKGKYLFVISEENVTIERLRLRGPWHTWTANSTYSQVSGIFFNTNAHNGKVQFCEIAGFPGVAVSFRSNGNIVYGNNIHHNYMIYTNSAGVSETIGYGVLVNDGGTATIHHNYFDNNQHAIAGGGKNSSGIESGFIAYMNNVKDTDGKMRSHHFDMHGSTDCAAGNIIRIYDNVFYYNARPNGWWPSAVMIRGIPQGYAYVFNNAFINDPNINSAVRQVREYQYLSCYGGDDRMAVFNNVCNGYPGDPYTTVPWRSEL